MENLNKKIKSTLNSVDGLQRAEAPTFFHTRAQARLEKRLACEQETWLPVRRPAWVIATLILMLAANVYLVASQPSKTVAVANENAETGNLQGFANSYGLSTSAGY